MKIFVIVLAVASAAPTFASDSTPFYRGPYASPEGDRPAARSSSPFYRTPFARQSEPEKTRDVVRRGDQERREVQPRLAAQPKG
ncbi:MAG TPA: hypothetical protein VFP65_12425 [Anaeromyxobacteraceae bacterium]|nr:hypothetical protein [Anaeromyxobacteraceae bacterium]